MKIRSARDLFRASIQLLAGFEIRKGRKRSVPIRTINSWKSGERLNVRLDSVDKISHDYEIHAWQLFHPRLDVIMKIGPDIVDELVDNYLRSPAETKSYIRKIAARDAVTYHDEK